MLDLKQLEADPEGMAQALRRRGDIPGLDEALTLARSRREAITRVETLQAERNEINKQMRGASKELIDENRARMRELSDRIKTDDAARKEIEERLEQLVLGIPNPPLADVPDGEDESANVEVRRVLEPTKLDFEPKDHVDLGEGAGILDFSRAAKLSGARFAVLRGAGARLSRAIATFMLDFHNERGDLELSPPLLVNPQTMTGTGQLPKFEEDLFKVPRGDSEPLYLIPTAEVPLTNYYADEILDEASLPLRMVAWTQCFRAEAGSAGKDTRGLIRMHQFDKVEMVRFSRPDQAADELDDMVSRASAILEALELPHRVVLLCTGDMGAAAEKTYDLEVWLPAQDTYREISSCSTCGEYQARRAKIRYRPAAEGKKKAKPRAIATLNGSGLAVGRTLVAILENHQQADGSIRIPDALRPYMGGLEKILPVE
jgi:seryl-tRNA synthetase